MREVCEEGKGEEGGGVQKKKSIFGWCNSPQRLLLAQMLFFFFFGVLMEHRENCLAGKEEKKILETSEQNHVSYPKRTDIVMETRAGGEHRRKDDKSLRRRSVLGMKPETTSPAKCCPKRPATAQQQQTWTQQLGSSVNDQHRPSPWKPTSTTHTSSPWMEVHQRQKGHQGPLRR